MDVLEWNQVSRSQSLFKWISYSSAFSTLFWCWMVCPATGRCVLYLHIVAFVPWSIQKETWCLAWRPTIIMSGTDTYYFVSRSFTITILVMNKSRVNTLWHYDIDFPNPNWLRYHYLRLRFINTILLLVSLMPDHQDSNSQLNILVKDVETAYVVKTTFLWTT